MIWAIIAGIGLSVFGAGCFGFGRATSPRSKAPDAIGEARGAMARMQIKLDELEGEMRELAKEKGEPWIHVARDRRRLRLQIRESGGVPVV